MDGGSLQQLLLFRPCPGLFLLGHVQPQLALMRQGRDGALKSTGDEPAARFNAHSVFGGERHSLAQRSVFNHRANGKKKKQQGKPKCLAISVFSVIHKWTW